VNPALFHPLFWDIRPRCWLEHGSFLFFFSFQLGESALFVQFTQDPIEQCMPHFAIRFCLSLAGVAGLFGELTREGANVSCANTTFGQDAPY
jgi:hypothetical protein